VWVHRNVTHIKLDEVFGMLKDVISKQDSLENKIYILLHQVVHLRQDVHHIGIHGTIESEPIYISD